MPRRKRWVFLGVLGWSLLLHGRAGKGAAEVKLDKDFLAGVIEKLPPAPFEKAGQYRGMVHSYRLVAIDPRARVFLVGCQIEGAFHPPVAGPISERIGRSPQTPEGWRKFRFEVKARVNIEPGGDAAPRFRVEIDEVKRRELDGFSGVLAKVLGQFFDEIVTQIASGRASRLNQKLNAEVLKRVSVFKEYGVFRRIDYTPTEVVLYFDLTRYQSEGVAGHVFAEAQPETVPLYRWFHPRQGSHFYTIRPGAPDRPNSVDEGITCHVFDHFVPGAVPLYLWWNGWDHFYTTTPNGEGAGRVGYRPRGIACYVYADPKPGTAPFYRFYDPTGHQHFYSTHPHAEFAK
jgi:hypothetical protein